VTGEEADGLLTCTARLAPRHYSLPKPKSGG
jgi:hypothetical protein